MSLCVSVFIYFVSRTQYIVVLVVVVFLGNIMSALLQMFPSKHLKINNMVVIYIIDILAIKLM